MPVPISNVPRRVVYAASGVGPYAFTFEILVNTDIDVYEGDTLLTLTTDYTVTINANGTGSVTLVSAASDQIAIVGARAIQRTSDFTTGGDFFANTVNDEFDSLTIFAQQNAEGLNRALIAPQTDPLTINMTLPRSTDRSGKLLAFDENGDPIVGEDIGNWRGNWDAGVAYRVRDLVKDPGNSNIYRCNTAHTSSGSAPISGNADSAKWDLVIDATAVADAEAAQAAAEAAQAAAEAAQAAAETAETNAASSASAASTSASNASTSATNASNSATAAASSASTASTAATNAGNSATAAATSATNASNSATAAASSASAAATSETNAASSASAASTSASNAASSASAASTSASNASTSATNASNSATAAAGSASSASTSASTAETAKNDVLALAATVGATIADWGFINTSPTSTSDYGAL